MEELFKQIANYGFPAVLSIFLLIRIESRIDKLSECINELSKTIASIEK